MAKNRERSVYFGCEHATPAVRALIRTACASAGPHRARPVGTAPKIPKIVCGLEDFRELVRQRHHLGVHPHVCGRTGGAGREEMQADGRVGEWGGWGDAPGAASPRLSPMKTVSVSWICPLLCRVPTTS